MDTPLMLLIATSSCRPHTAQLVGEMLQQQAMHVMASTPTGHKAGSQLGGSSTTTTAMRCARTGAQQDVAAESAKQ